MFQGCLKRIDFVLAFTDDGDALWADEYKLGLMTTMVKIGLDLEIERATLPEHNNVLFCKIHAPDTILDDYKDYFEVTKRFQDNHVHFIGRPIGKPAPRQPSHEREWVKLMRLLRNNVILDAYALHDGPYFITEDQPTCNVNGRQILYYNWAGYRNLLTFQPLSVIYEYYGPKLAMYFAYYQFYMTMLIVCMPITPFFLLPLVWRTINSLVTREVSNMYCKADSLEFKRLCPTCMDFNACPIRNLSEYCEVHKFVRLTQKIMTMSPIFTMWCIAFYFFWKRKHNYLRWLWELNIKPKHPIVRVEYTVNYPTAKRTKVTGAWRLIPLESVIRYNLLCPFLAAFVVSRYNDTSIVFS
ncbi:anoctamin-7-like isoform X2 [Hyposmocoma kahamanoa]|uniref:anoctamin-7-like isoform X2 n=1 Tax=Hyposmocoma kahamanoa TaxID=1477025 RepID=UPI000E6D928B|nr:anoctamin-7-like isoform X2 [Hyposmocoma kahamanoa]